MARAAASPILQLIRRVVEDPQVRELPDRDLLQRFRSQHDEAAFHTLLRRHGPMVLDVCRGVLGDGPEVEDAFQATFLVLAQRAGSIRKGASLGSWLHGVAHRTALKARAQSAVRQKHEACAPQRQASVADDLSWQEVRQVLHEELGGIPERYREPLVMCYLEGATQQRAAARLGLAERTVRERLERGRELLRLRLVRRGLGPVAVLAVAAWPAATASAAVSSVLVDSTIQAATSVAAGGVVTSAVSAEVAALTEGVMKAMFLTKIKIAAAALLVAAIVSAATVAAGFPVRADQPPQPPKTEKATPPLPGVQKPKLADAGAAVDTLAWSPDGKSIATQVVEWSPTRDGGAVRTGRALQIRDAETGAVRRTLYDEDNVRDIRFSPDGKSVAATLAGENVVKLWDPATGKEKKTFDGVNIAGASLTNIAFSRDGRLLAAAGWVADFATGKSNGAVFLWETASGKLVWQVEGHTNQLFGLVFSPDGKLLATASRDKTIKLWDTATGKCKQTLEGHESGVFSLAFSPDGKLLASGGLDGTVRLWDPDSGELKYTKSGYIRGLKVVVAFSPDGRRLAAGGTILGSTETGAGTSGSSTPRPGSSTGPSPTCSATG
jgi:RNA polymerase sigma factor (sigma-70 family)